MIADWHASFATRVIFSVAFAIDVEDENDPFFKLGNQMGWIISNFGNNGLSILDVLPWCKSDLGSRDFKCFPLNLSILARKLPHWIGKYIPSVKYVQEHAPTIHEFHRRPFESVMSRFVSYPHVLMASYRVFSSDTERGYPETFISRTRS